MARAKSHLELIKKVTDRNTTFLKRKVRLLKKAQELAILCGIKTVVIIYGPKQAPSDTQPVEPETWPTNREEVVELINRYKSQSPEDCKKRTSLLSDFFLEINKKAQQALIKLRSTNIPSQYPTWDPMFDMMQEDKLRRISGVLAMNIENAKAKLQQMTSRKRSMEFEAVNQANKRFITMNPYQNNSSANADLNLRPMPIQMHMPIEQQNMVNFGSNYVGGISNVLYNVALPSKLGYNDPMMAGTIDSLSYVNNFERAPLMHSYGDAMQPMVSNSLNYHPAISGSTHHQIAAATSHQDGDYDQYVL